MTAQQTAATSAAEPAKSSSLSRQRKRARIAGSRFALVTMLGPAGLLLMVLFLGPICLSLFTSTQATGTPISQTDSVGLANYQALLQDSQFWHSLLISVIYTAGSVSIAYGLGLCVALMVNFRTPLARVAQGFAIVPWAMPYVAAAMIWTIIFDYQYGPLNWLLRGLGIIDSNIGWLTSPQLALGTVIFIQVWKLFPLASVLLLSALQAVPSERLEAAAVDGANAWSRFVHVLLPGIRGVTVILTLLLTMWVFGRSFTVVYVLTGGGPANATATLVIRMFELGFVEFDPQMASALGVLVMLISAVVAAIYWRFGLRKVEAE